MGQSLDYLPLTSSVFWLQWRLWGSEATGYHVVNILLHAANAVLLWLLLKRLKVPGAYLACLVFAVHPVNVASVAWVSELKNTLSMFFFVLAVLAFLRFQRRCRWQEYVLCLAMFLLALLSKASVVMLPVVLLLCAWWQRRRIALRDVLLAGPFFVLAVAFGLVAVWFQHHRAMGAPIDLPANFLERLALAGRAAWFYLYKALLPVNLSMVYPRWNVHALGVLSFVPVVSLVLAAGLLWWYRRRWARPLVLGLGCHLLLLLPVLGFVDMSFMEHSFVADHFHYLAIIGVVAVAVGLAWHVAGGREGVFRWLAISLGVAVVAALSALTFRRAQLYADELTLWGDTIEKNPGAWVAYNNRGLAYASAGNYRNATSDYNKAIELNPNYPQAYNNRGIAHGCQGDYDRAIADFDKAIQLTPRQGKPYNNRALAYAYKGDYRRAIRDFDKAIELDSKYGFVFKNGRITYGRKGGHGPVIQLNPKYALAYSDRGAEWVGGGQYDRAIRDFDMAIRLNPTLVAAYNNRGIARAYKGDYDRAIRDFEKAIELDPNYTAARENKRKALAQEQSAK